MMKELAKYFIEEEQFANDINVGTKVTAEEKQEFTIDNDQSAEWALLRLKEDKAEMDRFIDTCEKQIQFYQEKIKEAKEKHDRKTGYLKGKLMEYFMSVPKKKTKTQEIYTLPSGKLKLKYPQPEYKRDDATLIKWLKDRDMTDYIKVSESPKWGELKKTVQVAGDMACIDGEIVDGIQIIEKAPVFDIEI